MAKAASRVHDDIALEAALTDDGEDVVVAIGGTGSGTQRQRACARSRASASVAFHGIGITPGETTALGFAGPRPVLLLPGRIDAALAGWLTVGRRMLARLAFRLIEEQPFAAELARKIASPLGLAEVVAVRAAARQGRAGRARAICRCRRWPTPRAGSWFRPTARAIRPARASW